MKNGKSLTDSLTDNFKSRDASASKKCKRLKAEKVKSSQNDGKQQLLQFDWRRQPGGSNSSNKSNLSEHSGAGQKDIPSENQPQPKFNPI